MKRMIICLVMAVVVVAMYAQKDVTTFLGIPVDGYKSEMRQNLIKKGFVPKKIDDKEYFEGEFNGTDVHVFIATNNNKVYRIMLCDVNYLSETDIKIRFNRLVKQFQNNKRYMSLEDYTLSDSEDISYEMIAHNKRYEAIFYQVPDENKIDTLALKEQLRNELLKKYSPEQIKNPSEEIKRNMENMALMYSFDLISKKSVWFIISEYYGKYNITMFYDNEYNHADGEDL